MNRILLGVLVFALGIAGTLTAQSVVNIHPQKLVIGTETAGLGSGANLEVFGPGHDGGISIVATGGATTSEAFLASFQRNNAGSWRKTMSISTHYVDGDPTTGYAVTRHNATYSDNGRQRDDLAVSIFGNHGVSIFEPNPTIAIGPGRKVFKVYGRIMANDMDVEATIAALEARIAQLESDRTIAPAPTAPTPGIVCNPSWFVRTADGSGCVPPDHPLAPKLRR